MKKYLIISVVAAGCLAGCGANENPGYSYMPDMTYSRAYETYAPVTDLTNDGVFFNHQPVPGTVARGEDAAFTFNLPHDSIGYAQSASLKNPLDSVGAKLDMKEAERLYLVNCGICHGAKLDGNGPLFNGGDGPYSAAPKNFLVDEMKAMTAGTMFYSVTYGKGQMGSYASQMSPKQRWEVIAYIKSKQGGGAAAPATGEATPSTDAAVDSTSTAKK